MRTRRACDQFGRRQWGVSGGMAVDGGRDALMLGVHPGRLDRHTLRLLVRFGVDAGDGACSARKTTLRRNRQEFLPKMSLSQRAYSGKTEVSRPRQHMLRVNGRP